MLSSCSQPSIALSLSLSLSVSLACSRCNGDLLLTRYVMCSACLFYVGRLYSCTPSVWWLINLWLLRVECHFDMCASILLGKVTDFLWQRDALLGGFHRAFSWPVENGEGELRWPVLQSVLFRHTHTMEVFLWHSRDLMTIAQVSYHVTVSVQPRLKLCCFCHFTGCVASVIITLLLIYYSPRNWHTTVHWSQRKTNDSNSIAVEYGDWLAKQTIDSYAIHKQRSPMFSI